MPWPEGATFKVLDMLSSRSCLKLENMCWPLTSISQINSMQSQGPGRRGEKPTINRGSENWENRPCVTWSPEKKIRVRVYFLRLTHKMGTNEIQRLGSKAEVSSLNLQWSTNSNLRIRHAVTREPGHRELETPNVWTRIQVAAPLRYKQEQRTEFGIEQWVFTVPFFKQ